MGCSFESVDLVSIFNSYKSVSSGGKPYATPFLEWLLGHNWVEFKIPNRVTRYTVCKRCGAIQSNSNPNDLFDWSMTIGYVNPSKEFKRT